VPNFKGKISTEQFIFKTIEYAKKKGTRKFKKNFSLEIRPELKIANFLFRILQIFCDSVIQSL